MPPPHPACQCHTVTHGLALDSRAQRKKCCAGNNLFRRDGGSRGRPGRDDKDRLRSWTGGVWLPAGRPRGPAGSYRHCSGWCGSSSEFLPQRRSSAFWRTRGSVARHGAVGPSPGWPGQRWHRRVTVVARTTGLLLSALTPALLRSATLRAASCCRQDFGVVDDLSLIHI